MSMLNSSIIDLDQNTSSTRQASALLSNHSTGTQTNLTPTSVPSHTQEDAFSEAEDEAETLWDRLFTISYEDYLAAQRVQRPLVYTLLPVAVALTLVNICVFRHPRMRSAAGTYVIGMSVAQILYLLNYAVEMVVTATVADYAHNYAYLWYSMFVTNYVAVVTLRGSFLVMCVLSVERLYAVLRPLHVHGFLLARRPRLFSLASFGLAAVWHVYLHAKYRVAAVTTGPAGLRYTYSTTRLYRHTAPVADGFSLAAKLLFTLGSLLVRLLLGLLTLWGLRRHNRATSRGVTSSSARDDVTRRRERQMTVTILTSSLASVLFFFPSAFHFVVGILLPEYYSYRGRYANFYRVMNIFTGSFALYYCSLDFFCFLAASSNYRAVLAGFLRRFLGQKGRKEVWCPAAKWTPARASL